MRLSNGALDRIKNFALVETEILVSAGADF